MVWSVTKWGALTGLVLGAGMWWIPVLGGGWPADDPEGVDSLVFLTVVGAVAGLVLGTIGGALAGAAASALLRRGYGRVPASVTAGVVCVAFLVLLAPGFVPFLIVAPIAGVLAAVVVWWRSGIDHTTN